ncbi:hypothetical protein E1301_Tti019735 [Triplophysa tibetana]|uniref:Uncharacterized protein n=1 Tax=Triplophysa tibetana TaxID=1572043 RepID=A0A5A9ND78_9TELE|nr:hypothetical protein E1301_Tti019735 [Triplophysa tibetana]
MERKEEARCLCKVHENLEFIVEKLHGLKLLERTELESLAEETCCNPTFKPCMYAECKNCKLQDLKIQSGYDGQTQVSCVQWTTETVLREKKSGDNKEKLPVNITGFTAGTWNFFEASHGKGAPDGVGGLLKRTADRLVSQGEDISTAKHLFNAWVNTNTAVKIFYIEEATVEKAIQQMPQRLPAVSCTMRIHQVITQAPGKLTYRDAFDFKVNSAVPVLHQGQPDLEVQWDRDDIVGQWCVIRYDDEVYPGTIVEVSETHVHIKCMHRVGHNHYYWPMREDALWYPFEDVLRLIPAHST